MISRVSRTTLSIQMADDQDSKAAITRETAFYLPKSVSLARVAEVRDKTGADNQSHINWLVTQSLLTAMSSAQRATDERSLTLEVMTSLGILQPRAIPMLVAELPVMIMRELRYALSTRDHKDTTPVSIALLFLASSLHMSPLWLEQYWADAAGVLSDSALPLDLSTVAIHRTDPSRYRGRRVVGCFTGARCRVGCSDRLNKFVTVKRDALYTTVYGKSQV